MVKYGKRYLGMVSILGDKSEVHSSYYPGSNTGGVLTGDTTNIMNHTMIIIVSFGILCLLIYRHQQKIHHRR